MFAFPGKLSRKIVGTLFVFFLVALSAIGMTLYLSWQLEGVAAAINDAGSQRMRTYRIGHLMARSLEHHDVAVDRSVQSEVERFDRVLLDLRQGDPARPMAPPRDVDVQARLLAVETAWRQTMRPQVVAFLGHPPAQRAAALDGFDDELEGFVGGINDLVLAMEHSYAANTNLLRTVQAALIVLATIGTAVLIRFFMQLVIRPVGELQAGIRRMANDDLAVRLPVTRDDELGSLASGFNQMAEHLQRVYNTLEERVAAETRSLAERNRELGILYGITAFLSEPAPLEAVCQGFLGRIRNALGADAGAVRLYTADTEKLYLMTHEGLSEEFVFRESEMNCSDCLCGDVIQTGKPVAFATLNPPPGMKLRTCVRERFATATAFNILYNKQRIGVFNLYFREQREVSEQEFNLLETLGQHLGVAVENQRLRSREKELAVSEERNLLAQELHDSIAQGLAFLNIQVQLLQDSLRKGRADEAMQTAGQLREGVQESYDDVRELLVHFRTRMHQSDLDSAIVAALEKFEGQTGIATGFERQGSGAPLEPTDEIQIMHIVQESLSNIRKHARAGRVAVTVRRTRREIEVVVEDDGGGFDPVNEPNVLSERHVGLRIMRERAHRIGGECQITSAPGKGTRVRFVLPKKQAEVA
ncbi:type IV pili methyl-accepting chemotaxis transducer N-terminal domain-containing protein [Dechloromonas sp. H13]|uniref:type IV pili methyl-accepting chemotaxis transducer N-terminal domain-containing protein n=1 Tax=Dechloromonas sp. H13 TaxID=2570193 RepID=UPI0012923FE1|nr:type IV pili methyl-accepting chemotaxis transducer N-terminal domain-containing protein [Dechloromonas sp. H13]